MAQYQKKPVIIEAFQFYTKMLTETTINTIPGWFYEACQKKSGTLGSFYSIYHSNPKAREAEVTHHIATLEGVMQVNDGDYIIRGITGELYPCTPDIFEATYVQVPYTTPLTDGKEIITEG